ncbi:hypothetical protein B0H14DRAFT_174365 [Mycena olivaceomarginata]|nr:hypothetical protein B0H14DRAFT_174365 [Mycena olivaceomarginata]
MLRRQRSLIALIAGSSTTNLEREDTVPPLPSAGVYSNGTAGIAADADARGGSVGKAGGGLFRRVSNLLRSGSRDNSHGSPTSARYRAASSTPDIHASGGSPVSSNAPSIGGGKLVKRPSVKARQEAQQRRMTGITEGEGARDRDAGEEGVREMAAHEIRVRDDQVDGRGHGRVVQVGQVRRLCRARRARAAAARPHPSRTRVRGQRTRPRMRGARRRRKTTFAARQGWGARRR